jgi:hypothetical protein
MIRISFTDFFAFYTAYKYAYMYNDLLNVYSGKKYIMICMKGVMVVLIPPLRGGKSTTITPFNPRPVRSSAYLPTAIYALSAYLPKATYALTAYLPKAKYALSAYLPKAKYALSAYLPKVTVH